MPLRPNKISDPPIFTFQNYLNSLLSTRNFKFIKDTYIEHRQLLEERLHPDPAENRPTNERFPPQLMRRFEISFEDPKARFAAVAVRNITARHIGKLVSVKGIVTRATEVNNQSNFCCRARQEANIVEILFKRRNSIFKCF